MGYNIVDIIDKSINIAKRIKKEYEIIGKEKGDIDSIKIMSIVLAKDADKMISYYEKLKKSIIHEELEDIAFDVYDKISFLINEFNKKNYNPEIHNGHDYLEFRITQEKDLLSLLIDIQGRFVRNKNDVNTKTYKILSEIIENKKKHIKNLEKAIKD
ncbi:MAG: hypothetical protein ACM3X7_05295 [Solirubrobacterales bacterium]